MPSLTVDERFCGPPGCANGGYFAGLLAQYSQDLVRVRIERPIPLQVALEVRSDTGGALELVHEGAILARAQPVAFELAVPQAPDYLRALDASRHFIGFGRHSFPDCFVCGTNRGRGDGLRVGQPRQPTFARALRRQERDTRPARARHESSVAA